MPQSLIAMLSMMIASLFAYNQHRNALTMRMEMISQDMELRQTNIAVDLMEEIGALAFDDATKAGTITSSGSLTFTRSDLLEGQGEEGTVITEAGGTDDIDDYHDVALQRTRSRDGHTLTFNTYSEVDYVTESGYSTHGTPSKLKKVEIKVISADIAFADTIQISQVFSCGARCDW